MSEARESLKSRIAAAEEKLKSRIAADMLALLHLTGNETVRFEIREGDTVWLRIWGATEEGWRQITGKSEP